VWEGSVDVPYLDEIAVSNSILGTFVDIHRGFQWKEVIGGGASTPVALAAVLRAGYLFVSPTDGQYTETIDTPPDVLIREPHLAGLTRELAPTRLGTWAATLFDYQPPRFQFRPSEQRMLLAAFRGGTDEDIAARLGVSSSAVKKAWHAIYERVSSRDPRLIPSDGAGDATASQRGKAKKQRLIAYLRDHPEELRPAVES